MALLKRLELLEAIKKDTLPTSQVFLFFGERYLCKETADKLQEAILSKHPGAVHDIDGESEDAGQTIARLMSFSLLPGRQIYRVSDSRVFHSKEVLSEIWKKSFSAYQAGRTKAALRHLQSMVQAVNLQVTGTTPITEIASAEWKKLFGFEKPQEKMKWADELIQVHGSGSQPSPSNIVERYIASLEKGLPDGNILVLTAETVDKRQRLFTYLKKNETVIDCSVASGSNMAAQKEQKSVLNEMLMKTLAASGKKIDPQAVDIFFERVGFHPVAVVTETEKLIHYTAERELITLADLEKMVARSREDALYELTDAFSKRETARTLTTLSHLLEQGIHGLAILATMRNFLRKQLIFRAIQLQNQPQWRQGMSAREFQNGYLPELKTSREWGELLKGHPYALYMSFTKAAGYSCSGLKYWLSMLLEAEFRLKGSPLPQQLVLEELFIAMLKGKPKVHSNPKIMV